MLLLGAHPLDSLGRDRIYLTARLGLLQVLRLSKAFQLIFIKDKGAWGCIQFCGLVYSPGSDSWYGNIIGVVTAIKVGGPGALFWMWMAGFGMATNMRKVY